MKKAIILVAATCIAALLFGCGGSSVESVENDWWKDSRILGEDRNALSVGESGEFDDFVVTVGAIEPYGNALRALIEIDAKSDDVELDLSSFYINAIDRGAVTLVDQNSELEGQIVDGQSIEKGTTLAGYLYFTRAGVSEITFKEGLFGDSCRWNTPVDEAYFDECEKLRYRTALTSIGFSEDESDNAWSIFKELGISGCEIEKAEVGIASGNLVACRTWMRANPAGDATVSGDFSHQINFTFDSGKLFYVEVTGFDLTGNHPDSFVLYDTDNISGGFAAIYHPEKDRVEEI